MKLIAVLIACVLVAGPAEALVCPRSDSIGNFLNYLQLYFQNDDQVFSFANTNSKIIKMWEEKEEITGTGTFNRFDAWLVQENINNAGSPVWLYMSWVVLDENEILKKVVNFGRFQVDPAYMKLSDYTAAAAWTDTMVYKLISVFFNINNADLVLLDSKFNNANEACKEFWTFYDSTGTYSATAVTGQLCIDKSFWGYDLATTGSCFSATPVKAQIAACSCVPGKFDEINKVIILPPKCTLTWNKPAMTTLTDLARTTPVNPLNTPYQMTTPTAVTARKIGKFDTVVFDSTQIDASTTPSKVVVTSAICDPEMMKLEYDNFYYMFANYYKNGTGKQLPTTPVV